jgi:hypothetical protein
MTDCTKPIEKHDREEWCAAECLKRDGDTVIVAWKAGGAWKTAVLPASHPGIRNVPAAPLWREGQRFRRPTDNGVRWWVDGGKVMVQAMGRAAWAPGHTVSDFESWIRRGLVVPAEPAPLSVEDRIAALEAKVRQMEATR